MANVFSNAFGSGTLNTSVSDRKTPPSERLRRHVATARIPVAGTGGTAGDIIRMGTFKSSDRIWEILIGVEEGTGNGQNGTADVGMYETGSNHDGIEVDADLFSTAYALADPVAHLTAFIQAGNLDVYDKGKFLWELMDQGSGTFATDPHKSYDLCLTIAQTTAVAATNVFLTVVYTSGD